jgi:hypothetical protein
MASPSPDQPYKSPDMGSPTMPPLEEPHRDVPPPLKSTGRPRLSPSQIRQASHTKPSSSKVQVGDSNSTIQEGASHQLFDLSAFAMGPIPATPRRQKEMTNIRSFDREQLRQRRFEFSSGQRLSKKERLIAGRRKMTTTQQPISRVAGPDLWVPTESPAPGGEEDEAGPTESPGRGEDYEGEDEEEEEEGEERGEEVSIASLTSSLASPPRRQSSLQRMLRAASNAFGVKSNNYAVTDPLNTPVSSSSELGSPEADARRDDDEFIEQMSARGTKFYSKSVAGVDEGAYEVSPSAASDAMYYDAD